MTAKLKEIDFKSLLIGFLLAAVFFLTIGASSGTRDVRIVGINTYDDLRVSVEKINTRDIPVKITDVDSSAELKVIINGTKYNDPIPVKIKE